MKSSSILNFRRWYFTTLGAILAACVLFFGATAYLIKYHAEPHDLYLQLFEVFKKAKEAETVNAIFGDSLSARGVLLNRLDFVNLAYGGEAPPGIWPKVQGLFDGNKAGKVILPGNPYTLFENSGEKVAIAEEEMFLNNYRPAFPLFEERHRYFILRYWKAFLVKGGFYIDKKILPYGGQIATSVENDLAFSSADEESRRSKSRHYARTQWVPSGKEPNVFGLYTKMIDHIQSRGGEICLVWFPYAKSFRDEAEQLGYDYEARFAPIWERFAAQSGVKFVNHYAYHDSDQYFWDPTHLNAEGGRLYGREIVKDCFGVDLGELKTVPVSAVESP